jgi:hypothetical protein
VFAVLCDPADRPALWATDRLRARLGEVRLVHLDALAFARPFVVTVDGEGLAASATLPDGTRFGPGSVAALLNRALRPPRPAIGGADAAYAAEEMAAATLAFLAAFGPAAVNRPDPASFAGRDPGPAGWLTLAAIAGLPTAPWRIDADGFAAPPPAASQALVIGEAAFGLPGAQAAAAVSLARLAGVELMGLGLAADGRVVEATAAPDLSLAGEAGADALAALLAGRA